ncbi:tyrosine-type recombinase/integrase [Labrenzia sp. R4_2]|uniref:tyrosine-type recombinase/integrase n=1 Tax=Labrenzia sp. R4_2 TaxID=2821107 RepID=UPI001ADBE7C5|nr:tyrosine-type recombinase/integrase [Labrenzia sp. R4_2]MBO9422324.1 tyrosine-type recombinase/integrase [Labrenzia sp. R4_2]
MPKVNKWWPKGFRVWTDKKPPYRQRCQHRNSKVMIDLDKYPARTASFYAECERVTKAFEPDRTKPGTLGALIEKYRASSAFTDLAPRTRADYQNKFDYLYPIRDTDLTRFTSPFIVRLRDKAAEQKGRRFANYVKAVISLVFSWGKDRGFVKDNPALGISNIRRKRGEPRSNRPWQDSERDAVLDAAPKHMRPAIALMMFTGLGPQDALTLHRDAIEGDFIDTARSKTGVELYLPIISPLREALAAAPKHDALTICANSKGQPWTVSGFRASWRKERQKLERLGKIRPGLTLYGLRHTVATIFREMGYDERAIADVLGQETIEMARLYSRRADLKRKVAGMGTAFEAEVNSRRTKIVKPGTE